MGFYLQSIHLVVWLLSVVLQSHSLSLHVEESNAILPNAIAFATAIYYGQDSIYIIGGFDLNTGGGFTDVFKYSIKENRVEKMGKMGQMTKGSGVWTGPNEIHYVGHDYQGSGSAVWRIDPTDLNNRVSVHNFTNEMFHNVAVWDGQEFIYSFGGRYTGDLTYKYSKKTNIVTEYRNLHTRRFYSTAVWDDVQNKAYIFGGYSTSFGNLDEILEFDPVTTTATTLNARLTGKNEGACAVWTGTTAYILGGYEATSSSRFKPSTETVESIQLDSSYKPYHHSCVWIEQLNRIYIFGGYYHTNSISFIDLNQEGTSTTAQPPTTNTTSATTITDATSIPSSQSTARTAETTTSAIPTTTSGSGESVLIDKLSDIKDGWESQCLGYHELQNFTCGNSTFLIPEEDRNGHVGYWAPCREDEIPFLCRINFRPSSSLWKQLKLLAYINGALPIEVVIQNSTGYHTEYFGGDGWTTLLVDLSQHFGIKLIQITPEYTSHNFGVIDQIELTA